MPTLELFFFSFCQLSGWHTLEKYFYISIAIAIYYCLLLLKCCTSCTKCKQIQPQQVSNKIFAKKKKRLRVFNQINTNRKKIKQPNEQNTLRSKSITRNSRKKKKTMMQQCCCHKIKLDVGLQKKVFYNGFFHLQQK